MTTSAKNLVITDKILDSLNDGLYVCDRERNIAYWSKSAERITGWSAAEVVGRKCRDNVLDHVDKDGRQLCGEEFCPLHRSMLTDKSSSVPHIVFGLTSNGSRLPMSVSVAPIHDPQGAVIGGVETFGDFTETYANLKRAKQIQTMAMDYDLPEDDRIAFTPFYIPHDIIGGDFYAIRQLDSGEYVFMLADVMGHGVAAALYTMHLSALWTRYHPVLANPVEFARTLNNELCKIVKDESFATAICGVVDPASNTIRFISAGGPPLMIFRGNHTTSQITTPGLPFGVFDNTEYDLNEFQCQSGDSLLLFSDGAIDIENSEGELLGTEGLAKILHSLDYPASQIQIELLQEALLSYSNNISLEDDLTFLEVRFL